MIDRVVFQDRTLQAGANEIIFKTSKAWTNEIQLDLAFDYDGDKSYVVEKRDTYEDLAKYAFRATLDNPEIQVIPSAQ